MGLNRPIPVALQVADYLSSNTESVAGGRRHARRPACRLPARGPLQCDAPDDPQSGDVPEGHRRGVEARPGGR
eukprot:5659703-Alexandrium_andersonii.AAC.1